MKQLRKSLGRAALVVGCGVALVAPLLTASPVDAAPVTINFSTTILNVNSDLSSVFTSGDSVTGSFTVETVPNSTGPTGAAGELSSYVVSNFNIMFPNYSAAANVGNISINNNNDFGNPLIDIYDGYSLTIFDSSYTSAPDVNGFSALRFTMNFEDRGAPPIDTLTDTQLLLDPASIFNFGHANLAFEGGRHVLMYGPVMSVAAVPLPPALPLFGTGLGILGFFGWRRRRKAQAA